MAFSYTTIDTTGIVPGGTIQDTHITNIHTAVNSIGTWFTGENLPGKLKLFPSAAAEASLSFPAGTAPTSLSNGDMWREGDVLKMRVSNATRTIAFTETATFTTLSLTTLTTSSALTANSLQVTTVSALKGATSVSTTADPAFVVRKVDDGSINFRVNTAANSVELLGGTSFSVFNAANTATLFQVTSTGNTSVNNLSVSGDVTGSVNFTGTINAVGNISRSGVPYALPYRLNAGGFTVNIGNGSTVIATGAQQPIVVIPYQCTIEACTIVTTETSGSITVQLQKKSETSNTWTTITNNLPLTAGTNSVSTPSVSAASGQSLNLAEGDILRLNVHAVATLKSAAIHFRVRRSET